MRYLSTVLFAILNGDIPVAALCHFCLRRSARVAGMIYTSVGVALRAVRSLRGAGVIVFQKTSIARNALGLCIGP